MAKKTSKIYYFYPIKIESSKQKIADLAEVFKGLKEIPAEKRLLNDGDGNFQLKKIGYDEGTKRWFLAFLKNQIDAPFKTKLNDEVECAESLEEDEFIGQECCVIYDEVSNVISLQNNKNSMSYATLRQFLIKYTGGATIILSAITYKSEYCEISDLESIEYRSVTVNYTEISELQKLAASSENTTLSSLAKIANDLSALNGKIEFGMGRKKGMLDKSMLRSLIGFFRKNPKCLTGLKVKMVDHDTIRIIDLVNNKVNSTINISVTKDDPKTFVKIFNAMNDEFDCIIKETLDKCNKFVED